MRRPALRLFSYQQNWKRGSLPRLAIAADIYIGRPLVRRPLLSAVAAVLSAVAAVLSAVAAALSAVAAVLLGRGRAPAAAQSAQPRSLTLQRGCPTTHLPTGAAPLRSHLCTSQVGSAPVTMWARSRCSPRPFSPARSGRVLVLLVGPRVRRGTGSPSSSSIGTSSSS